MAKIKLITAVATLSEEAFNNHLVKIPKGFTVELDAINHLWVPIVVKDVEASRPMGAESVVQKLCDVINGANL